MSDYVDVPLDEEDEYGADGALDLDPDADYTRPIPPQDFLEEYTTEDPETGEVTYDYASAEGEFLKFIRETYQDDWSADEENREAALEDLKFLAGDQWPDRVRRKRLSRQKPVLTLNRLPAFIGLVVNQRRMNEAAIHVLPDETGDKKIAEIRQGLIRSIEKRNRAQTCYNRAHLNQVACGDGAWKVCLEYADDDVFEQDIKIKPIPNALSVVWDRMSVDPTGADADHVFVEDYYTEREFKRAFPDARVTSFSGDAALTSEARGEGWFINNTVRVVEFWRMREEMRTLILTQTGEVMDVTDEPQQVWLGLVAVNPETGRPYVRRSRVRYAEMYVTNGLELLEGPYRMPIPRLPVVRAVGWEVYVGQKVERFGLVRFLKDSQRMHNYWRSVVVEKLMQTPRAKWIAPSTAVEGREQSFRTAAQSDDPLLVYNGDAGTAPQLMPPAQMEEALINEAGMAAQDIRDISNLHEASLGMVSNEVSGKAISARQRVGETGTALYQDNLNLGIEETGRILNKLIPYVYDTARTVRILGTDDREMLQEINTSADNKLDLGKYDVTIVTGPSYATKRQEAAESMLNMVNAMPQTMQFAADKIVEAQDWPGAEAIAKRLRAQLPPGMVDEDELSDEERAMRQQAAQVAQRKDQIEERSAMAEIAMKEAQAADYQARAQQAQAQAAKAFSEIDLRQAEVFAKLDDMQIKTLLEAARTYAEMTDQGDENYG